MTTPRALSRAFFAYCRAQTDESADLPAAEQRLARLGEAHPADLRALGLRHGIATARCQLQEAERQLTRAHRAERRVTQTLADREYQLALAERTPPGAGRARILARVPPVPTPAPDRSAIESRIVELQDRISTLEKNRDQEAR